jgi:molecular chaperone DnaJ
MMRQMAQQDVYALLGVKSDAKIEDIRRAYRKWAVKMHPDRNPGKEAESKFKEISAAYEVLSNTESRKKYDAAHGIGAAPPPPPNYPVADVSVQLDLTAAELTQGCDKVFTVSRPRTCPDCRGTGRLWNAQRKMCVLCMGAGCGSCGFSGQVVTEFCARCWSSGSDKELTNIVLRVPPNTQCGGRRRLVAHGELWGMRGPFYVDAYVSFRANQPGLIIR